MNFLYLTKSGRNVQIVAYNDVTNQARNFFEDSSNVELIFNLYNYRVTLNIKGNFSFTTDNVVDNDVLYIDSGSGQVLIKDSGNFNAQYSLLFLNGGSVPSTPQNLQDTLNNGTSASNSSGNNSISLLSDNFGANVDIIINPNEPEILLHDKNSGITNRFFNTGFVSEKDDLSYIVKGDCDEGSLSVEDVPKAKTSIFPGYILTRDNQAGRDYRVDFPTNSQQNVSFPPDQSGTLQIRSLKKVLYKIYKSFAPYPTILYNCSFFGTQNFANFPFATMTPISTGVYQISFTNLDFPVGAFPTIFVNPNGSLWNPSYTCNIYPIDFFWVNPSIILTFYQNGIPVDILGNGSTPLNDFCIDLTLEYSIL
jgi:archaellum component FlaG (FlaF/FlaG flagellin family)